MSVQMGGSHTERYGVFGQTSQALADFRPGYAKFYSMADLTTQSRRRWVPMEHAVDSGRVETMFRHFFAESGDWRFATFQVADAFAHGVIGRVTASFVTYGRAWDTSAENIAVRTDIDGGLDWAGVRDTTLRLLPDDVAAGAAGTITLPCEEALAHYIVGRSASTLAQVYEGLSAVSRCDPEMLWSAVGECVLGAATLTPNFAGTGQETGHRRGQQILQCMHDRGLAVRTRVSSYVQPATRCVSACRVCVNPPGSSSNRSRFAVAALTLRR